MSPSIARAGVAVAEAGIEEDSAGIQADVDSVGVAGVVDQTEVRIDWDIQSNPQARRGGRCSRADRVTTVVADVLPRQDARYVRLVETTVEHDQFLDSGAMG